MVERCWVYGLITTCEIILVVDFTVIMAKLTRRIL